MIDLTLRWLASKHCMHYALDTPVGCARIAAEYIMSVPVKPSVSVYEVWPNASYRVARKKQFIER